MIGAIVLSDILDAFQTIIAALLDSMGNVADFFLTNTLGLIILGVALFGIVWALIMQFVDKIHK